jgi:hypothetical protein
VQCLYGLDNVSACACFYDTSMGHYTWHLVPCTKLFLTAQLLLTNGNRLTHNRQTMLANGIGLVTLAAGCDQHDSGCSPLAIAAHTHPWELLLSQRRPNRKRVPVLVQQSQPALPEAQACLACSASLAHATGSSRTATSSRLLKSGLVGWFVVLTHPQVPAAERGRRRPLRDRPLPEEFDVCIVLPLSCCSMAAPMLLLWSGLCLLP